MSFGNFPLFNFFQQPDSGVRPLKSSIDSTTYSFILNDNAKTGTIADFNWFYPYANEAFPVSWLNPAVPNNRISLLTDSFDNGIFPFGLRYATVSSSVSGKQQGNSDYPLINLGMNGVFFGKDDFYSFLNINTSGRLEASPPDINAFYFGMTGSIFGVGGEGFGIYPAFTGKFQGITIYSYVRSSFSGKIEGITFDGANHNLDFSGNFHPVLNDEITGYNVGVVETVIPFDFDDSCSLNYGITAITVSTNS